MTRSESAMNPIIISTIRTVIAPFLAGTLLQFLILLPVEAPEADVRAATVAVLSIAWYLGVRYLETINRFWGSLLLVATSPDYGDDVESQLLTSVKRTVVPLIAGWAVARLAVIGFEVDAAALAISLQGTITAAYYGILRQIEERTPQVGVLLGGRTVPTY